MKVFVLIAVLSSALLSLNAQAQYVKGNEAVKSTAAGKVVETPPMPTAGPISRTKPCLANANCFAGAWLMIETNEGLVECTEAYARPGTCRPSSYGTKKASRLWVVKRGGDWLQCQYPDLASKCVNMFARPPANMPYDAVQ